MAVFATDLGSLRLELEVYSTGTPDVVKNTSTVWWELRLVKESGAPWSNWTNYWYSTINGVNYSGSTTYNFANYTVLKLRNGTQTIAHNSDGTKTINVSGRWDDHGGGSVADGSVSGSLVLPKIARPSKSTFASPVDAGTSLAISTNRESTSFTHTLEYFFGNASGTIATGVGTSYSWTVPMSLLEQIPNATSGVGHIKTTTYSGTSLVGSTTTSLTVTAPASVKPTISSISRTEAVSAVASNVGAFVNQVSRLNLAIVGAAGAYGSTITSYKLTLDEHTINAVSGTTGALSLAGTRTITATVIDSRQRSTSLTANVEVLPYSQPTINTETLAVGRSFPNGTLNMEGTSIKVTFAAAVASLVNGTEKNKLTYRLSTRANGETVWNVVQSTLAGGVSVNTSSVLVGPYSIDSSFDVLLEVVDLFATSGVSSTVATSKIFMHWDGSIGVGIGKYREQGSLDVSGQIYQGGLAVLDRGDIGVAGGVSPVGHAHTLADLTVASIGGGANLNDYVAQGMYHQNSNSNAATGSNYPVAVAGLLEVAVGQGGTFVYQTYRAYAGGATYRRSLHTTTWSQWMPDDWALPEPQITVGASTQSITATSWTAIPNLAAISISAPYACWVDAELRAWMNSATDLRMGISVTGATTSSESTPAWGAVAYPAASKYMSMDARKTIRLNAGTTTFTPRAYRSGTATDQVNYAVFTVTPLRWAK
jgi:hypothetical protein